MGAHEREKRERERERGKDKRVPQDTAHGALTYFESKQIRTTRTGPPDAASLREGLGCTLRYAVCLRTMPPTKFPSVTTHSRQLFHPEHLP